MKPASRRSFIQSIGIDSIGAIAADGLLGTALAQTPSPGKEVLGEAGVKSAARSKKVWKPVSDRKIRVGIVGGRHGSNIKHSATMGKIR
jgi:hypothetical protein